MTIILRIQKAEREKFQSPVITNYLHFEENSEAPFFPLHMEKSKTKLNVLSAHSAAA